LALEEGRKRDGQKMNETLKDLMSKVIFFVGNWKAIGQNIRNGVTAKNFGPKLDILNDHVYSNGSKIHT